MDINNAQKCEHNLIVRHRLVKTYLLGMGFGYVGSYLLCRLTTWGECPPKLYPFGQAILSTVALVIIVGGVHALLAFLYKLTHWHSVASPELPVRRVNRKYVAALSVFFTGEVGSLSSRIMESHSMSLVGGAAASIIVLAFSTIAAVLWLRAIGDALRRFEQNGVWAKLLVGLLYLITVPMSWVVGTGCHYAIHHLLFDK